MTIPDSRAHIQLVVYSAIDGEERALSIPTASRHPSELVQKVIAKVGTGYIEKFRIELKAPLINILPVLEYWKGWEVECSENWAWTWLQTHVNPSNAMGVLVVVAGLRVTELYPLLLHHCSELRKSALVS
jgi:hypothetical protein